MKITIFSQFYPPEMEPTGYMINSLATHLSESDEVEHVDVLCGFANFPAGKFSSRRWYELFKVNKRGILRIINLFVVPSDNKNNFKRIVNYISFLVSSFLYGLFKRRSDVYFASSPPIFVALSGLLVSKLKRAKFILDIRDIWPESAVQMGSLNNKYLIKVFEYLEKKLYLSADKIVVATPGMISIIISKVDIPKDKVVYIPCGIHIPELTEKSSKNTIIDKTKFSVLYGGLHGHAQNLSVICEAAAMLVNVPDIHFYLIGDGPDKENLTSNPKYSHLANLSFFEPVEREEIRNIYQNVSCALVPLRDLAIFKNVFPSKTFELWSYSVPTVVGVGGEIDSIIDQHNCAVKATPDDPQSFKDGVLRLYRDEEYRLLLAVNSRYVAETYFSYAHCNKNFMNVFRSIF